MSEKRDFLTLMDYTGEELNELLNMADQLKYEQKNAMEHPRLKGKTLGMIFRQHSTRTRVSFEAGMYQLGALPCSCLPGTCKWSGENRCRTLPGSSAAIWTD